MLITKQDFDYCKGYVDRGMSLYYRIFPTPAMCLNHYFFSIGVGMEFLTTEQEFSMVKQVTDSEVEEYIESSIRDDISFFESNKEALEELGETEEKSESRIIEKRLKLEDNIKIRDIHIEGFDFDFNVDKQIEQGLPIYDYMESKNRSALIENLCPLFSLTEAPSYSNYRKAILEKDVFAIRLALFSAMVYKEVGVRLLSKYGIDGCPSIEKSMLNGDFIITELEEVLLICD